MSADHYNTQRMPDGSQSMREINLFQRNQAGLITGPGMDPVEEDDEEDLKQVIKILNDQVLKKSSEISAIKK